MVEKAKKTGVVLCRRRCQLSVSPQGFPRENITPSALETELRPLFTGQVFFAAEGLPQGDSRGATGAGLACLPADAPRPRYPAWSRRFHRSDHPSIIP